ncbi:MAG: efflux RND transporter periplasmic adaptor subunit [Phycisphaerae bacterium]|nr:efflux RND transporter periplasmic adaptor subunit [Phycisphaerae bacterium]
MSHFEKLGRHGLIALLIAIGAAAFALGYAVRGSGADHGHPADAGKPAAGQAQPQEWTCSMHPQIRQPKPGKCPICAMDLIPVTTGKRGKDDAPRQLTLSPRARKLAEIETSPVERRFVSAEIRMVGKVEYDETRVKHITAWIPGRIDRLYVDYTGVPVHEGDHMVYLYSPELLAAQEELIQAIKSVKDLKRSGLDLVKESAQLTVEAAREKLHLMGLVPKQIEEIERRGEPVDRMNIDAPMSGIVIDRNAVEGMYVKTGTRIYTIADLSVVWVKLDAYESDLMWVRYGQEVTFETEAYPGEVFKGRIVFIDPVLNPNTRSVKVRVNVPNPDGRLKPEMFVRAVARAKVAAGGKVMDPTLAGKWISPRHPEIIKDGPGTCDICGIPLVPVESLGYVSADADKAEAPLVIPASAALITGKRAVVYVEAPGKEGTYEGREIVLGPRAGDYYLVDRGLAEGERVVTRGNFKIDSAVQIQARPSMMNPEPAATQAKRQTVCPVMGNPIVKDVFTDYKGKRIHFCCPPCVEKFKKDPDKYMKVLAEQGVSPEDAPAGKAPEAFRKQLGGVLTAYFEMQQALSKDDLAGAHKAAEGVGAALKSVDMKLLTGPAHVHWMGAAKTLDGVLAEALGSKEINGVREKFALLSDELIKVVRRFGTIGKGPVVVVHCPMAFGGRGADWLANKTQIENPYFGKAMFGCGEVTETLLPGSGGK